jgi:hypothetical protein
MARAPTRAREEELEAKEVQVLLQLEDPQFSHQMALPGRKVKIETNH